MASELIKEQTPRLVQIISEVEKLDDEEKRKLLTELRKKKILSEAERLDSISGTAKADAMTDDEVDNYLSEKRRLRYEQSKA